MKSQYRQIRGRKGLALNSKIKKFHVFERHVPSVAELERENEQLKQNMVHGHGWLHKMDELVL